MSTTASFEAFIAHQDGCVVVKLRGEVDMAVTGPFEAVMREAIKVSPHVVFDVADVTFIDSSGLHVLAATALHVGEGGSVTTRNTPSYVARVIELAGLNGVLTVELPPAP